MRCVVSVCGSKDQSELSLTNVTNRSGFISPFNAPSTGGAFGQLNNLHSKITVNGGLREVNDIGIGGRINGNGCCYLCLFVVITFGKCDDDGICTGICNTGERRTVFISIYKLSLVRSCYTCDGENFSVINGGVAVFCIVDCGSCLCNLYSNLSVHYVVVNRIGGSVDNCISSCYGSFNSLIGVCPSVALEKLDIRKLQRCGPNHIERLLEIHFGIDLVNGERSYLSCGIVGIRQAQLYRVGACIDARNTQNVSVCILDNNNHFKIFTGIAVCLLNCKGNLLLVSIIVEDSGANDFDNH